MANAYEDLVVTVRDWANRDTSALPDSIVQSCLYYAADEAYRSLRIPPLEASAYYVVTSDGLMPGFTGAVEANVTPAIEKDTVGYMNYISFPVPSDSTSFQYLRLVGRGAVDENGDLMLDALGNPLIADTVQSKVYNEKTDIRTFHDVFAEKTTNGFWTREQSSILAAGHINECDIFELHYYRRLCTLNKRLDLPDGLTLAAAIAEDTVYEVISSVEYDELNTLTKNTYTQLEGSYVRSKTLEANWLMDENERVLLYGALQHVFDYLKEPDQMNKYVMRFKEAINELNVEEKFRTISGGNHSINYNPGGLL